jgi:DNA-binding LacI/PurR family transcriptional regulator
MATTDRAAASPATARVGSRARQGAVTIRQVAAAAGVSRATASRVINGSPLASEEARRAVEAAIADLGFTPSPAARSLALGRTNSVALVLPEPNARVLSDPFFAQVILGLSAELDQTDLQMVLLLARAGQRTDRIDRYLAGRHVDGAVIASHHRDDALNQRLVDSGLPCVFFGRPLTVSNAHYVDIDNVTGARLATQHLVDQGRRHIATIAGPPDMTAGIDRLEGWREVVLAAGLSDAAVGYGDFTQASGATAMEALLAEHPGLDAVFATSDLMAAGALEVLGGMGRKVPDDVSVVGFDDFPVAETTKPPLTTVSHPVQTMSARAGRMLLDLLSGQDVGPDPVIFPPQLVLRSSA